MFCLAEGRNFIPGYIEKGAMLIIRENAEHGPALRQQRNSMNLGAVSDHQMIPTAGINPRTRGIEVGNC